jgi:putative two-component system response regulator
MKIKQLEVGMKQDSQQILIVEDEENVLRLIDKELRSVGYPCQLARNAQEARALMERQVFALIISDINLPGESGLELVNYVAHQYPDTAIIMESGIDDQQTTEGALTIGAYGYLIKPFDSNQLRIQVFNALRRRKLEIENRRYLQNLEAKVRERTQALLATVNHLQKSIIGTINLVASTVEIRDPYTAGHQRRVSDLAAEIANEMGLTLPQAEGIRLAGLVHDVGKIFIPAEILGRPGKITDIEFAIIKTHAQVGYQLLKPIDFPWPIALIVHQHHERMDGSGYPRGLSGEEIILEARVLAVADVVEAIASHRPYRPALGIDKALEEINAKAGILFDATVVEACILLFREKEFGLAWEKIESLTAGFPNRSDGGMALGPGRHERSEPSPSYREITPFDQETKRKFKQATFLGTSPVIPPGQWTLQE